MRADFTHNRRTVRPTLRLVALLCAALLVAAVARPADQASGAPSAKAPAKVGPVLFIGDSVGASIKRLLPSLLDAGGYPNHFDALSGRCTKRWSGGCARGDAFDAIDALPRSFRPTIAVIELGYNDVPKRLPGSIDSVMQRLVDLGVQKVYWINLSERHPSAGGTNAFDRSNQILRDAGGRWGSKLTVLDWNSASAGGSKTKWFVQRSKGRTDLIHLTSSGQKQFAHWIRDELDRLRADGSLPGTEKPPDTSNGGNGAPTPTSGSGSGIPAKDRPEVIVGNQGPMVKELQVALNARGAKIWTDGDFGPGTERAVKAFQRSAGLVPDGRVGPKTWKALGF